MDDDALAAARRSLNDAVLAAQCARQLAAVWEVCTKALHVFFMCAIFTLLELFLLD
jgi:hypothetical protein